MSKQQENCPRWMFTAASTHLDLKYCNFELFIHTVSLHFDMWTESSATDGIHMQSVTLVWEIENLAQTVCLCWSTHVPHELQSKMKKAKKKKKLYCNFGDISILCFQSKMICCSFITLARLVDFPTPFTPQKVMTKGLRWLWASITSRRMSTLLFGCRICTSESCRACFTVEATAANTQSHDQWVHQDSCWLHACGEKWWPAEKVHSLVKVPITLPSSFLATESQSWAEISAATFLARDEQERYENRELFKHSPALAGWCLRPTNEVVLHFLQYWLHVLTGQVLGAHQALQHPKHATKSTRLLWAEKEQQSYFPSMSKGKFVICKSG